jgi:oligopeptide/dipeptide ABC transporter ATP-binding protein
LVLPNLLANIEFGNQVVMIIVEALMIFLIGIFFIKWYANRKLLTLSSRNLITFNLALLSTNVTFGLIFQFLFGYNLHLDLIVIGINLLFGTLIGKKILVKRLNEALSFNVIIQAFFLVVIVNLELFFGMGFIIESSFQEVAILFNTQLMTNTFFSIVNFVIGILLVRFYSKRRNWENTATISIIINTLWIIIEFSLPLLLFLISSYNLFFNSLIIVFVNTIIGLFVLSEVFYKDWRNSLGITSIVQSIIAGIKLFISIIITFSIIFYNFDDLGGAVLTYLISAILILGSSIFFIYWGDKIQLVGLEKTLAFASMIPGLIYITSAFFIQTNHYINNFSIHLIIGLILSLLSGFILKTVSYANISFQSIRELGVLEKGKKLLRIENLKVYYPLIGGFLKRQIGAVKAVDDISFDIKTGETLGLVGESGCGKTTVAKTILGLVEKEAGDITFHNDPIPKEYSTYLRQKIQIVFQDPDASLNPRMRVVNIIAEPLKNLLGITNKSEIRNRTLKLMEEVSLKREHLDRYPHEFSGGQKQRILIARALACNPELIILDEPTSALDVSVQAQILNLLKNLQKTYGYGFLFITHNLSVVNHVADRVAVMYLGRIVEIGTTKQIFSNPTHPYTQALLASRSEIDPYNQEIKFVIRGEVPSPINPPSGCPFNPRCSSDARTKECEYKLPLKIKIEENHFIWCTNLHSVSNS